jgi:proteic killer suppression protein
MLTYDSVIRRSRDRATVATRAREVPRSRLLRTALRKLAILDAAVTLDHLRVPPGSRLEALRGDQRGQHSIRINDQRRICFTWTDSGPEGVEIVDYH